jgi:predicted DNA-binding protein (MmcQ/YjbR family)
MNLETFRKFCLSMHHATEDVKWGDHLCFLIGGKMFCITSLNPAAPAVMTFKVDPDEFDELVEREGMAQAAYCAKRHWVSVERFHHMRDGEIRERLAQSYELVKTKLTKKKQVELGSHLPAKSIMKAKKSKKTSKKK